MFSLTAVATPGYISRVQTAQSILLSLVPLVVWIFSTQLLAKVSPIISHDNPSLHTNSILVSDKLTQNEIEELEGTLEQSAQSDTSFLRELLDKIPDSILGGNDEKQKIDEIQQNANAAQMQNTSVSPRDPEEFTLYVKNIFDQVMPAIKLHDDIMKSIAAAIDKIPVLPKIIEQLEEQLSQFVFSIIAPFVVPLIRQIRNELKTGSEEIIQSSENQQHVVFNDDNSTDPTHSMLSKDHFSNVCFSTCT